MPRKAADFRVFEKTSHNSKSWYVNYRDEEGNRLTELSLQKMKKELGKKEKTKKKQKDSLLPIADRDEAVKIAQAALDDDQLKERIFNRKKDSPLFVDYVNEIWDYNNSKYIQERLKEKKSIKQSTCRQNKAAFNTHIVPLLNKHFKKLTLAEIDYSQGTILSELRGKIIQELDSVCSSAKNKAFQAMRTALDFAYERGKLKHNYKDRLKNTPVDANGANDLTIREINNVLSYLNDHTTKGTYERNKYLLSALAASTGMREGELEALKATDGYKIDKKKNLAIIKVQHSIDTDGEYSTRKNKEIVYVATELNLWNEIVEFGRANPFGENYCFWDRNHMETHIPQDYFKGMLTDALLAINFKSNGRKISFYSMRKTAATITANANEIGAIRAAELLNHKSGTGITKKHYISSTPEGAVRNYEIIKKYIKIPK